MIKHIKNILRSPSAEAIALRELESAKRELLQMYDTQEYAAKMVEFYQGKVRRLTAYIKKEAP